VIGRLEHEFSLGEELALPWAAAPLELLRQDGRMALVLEDPGGLPLASLLSRRLSVPECLQLGSGLAAALSQVHAQGLIHKNIKPEHVLADLAAGAIALTGFGLAARRSRRSPEAGPPETLAGTLAYMAPEQTGRMNRGVDARSDLYALGVVLYEALTGDLPFDAADPLELIHSHLARRPLPPSARDPTVPPLLSDLVLKLLAKIPEERYQTARGVETDLRRCLAAWNARGRLPDFPLAEHDLPERLPAPGRLYGRSEELRHLLAAWERVAAGGGPELALVSGYPGVGKSSLVEELQQRLALSHGLFAGGKYEQYKRGIPYATLAQAFQALLRRILVLPEEEVGRWRRELGEALRPNGSVLVEIAPELGLLLGRQAKVPELAPREARNRFRAVVVQFLGVFATKEHPLVLFLDDLQWLDPATLELIEHLLAEEALSHLLLIGAYRVNEVDVTHPLARVLGSIRKAGAAVTQVVLPPLAPPDVRSLLADLLRSPGEEVEPLARLVQEKTGGNPFFALQFLANLFQEGLLAFSPAEGRWKWDVANIAAKGYTDNVVDFMARKLTRLSVPTLEALKALAVLGVRADAELLARALGIPRRRVRASLAEAESLGLVVPMGDGHAFVHDRIREAAYGLIPPEARRAEHLRMGRLLLAGLSAEEVGEEIFEVAGHFHEASALLRDPREREQIRRLALRAAGKSKAAIAFEAARGYLAEAVALLPDDAWRTCYAEAFSTHLELAECEYLVGSYDRSDGLFDELLRKAESPLDQAAVHRLRMQLYQVSGKYAEAVDTGLEALRLFGVRLPEQEGAIQSAVEEVVASIRSQLRGRTLADIASAPEIADPVARTVLELLTETMPPAYNAKPQYHLLISLMGLDHCLRHGNAEAACMAYSLYAVQLAGASGDVKSAMAFSELSVALNERYGDAKRKQIILFIHGGSISPWARPIATCQPIMDEAFAAALNVGDYVSASYTSTLAAWALVEAGLTFEQVRAGMRRFVESAARTRNEVGLQVLRQYGQFLACLEGSTGSPSSFDGDAYREEAALLVFRKADYLPGIAFFHIMKQIAAFLFGQYEEAIEHAGRARQLVGDILIMPIHATHFFFHALTLSALHSGVGPERRTELAERLDALLPRLKRWADDCPENHLNRYLLVLAEKARIEGRDLEAIRLYEQAIDSARDNGFLHLESLACERAAGFFLERNLRRSAHAHLRDARAGYLRWGAAAKVAQLDRLHPGIERPTLAGPTATLGAAVNQLDLPQVIKAAQAVSGEIELGNLIETLLRLVLEQAGADRGLILLPQGNGFMVEAEADMGPGGIHVRQAREPAEADRLSESVLRYVARTKERVLLDDAASPGPLFAEDAYLSRRKPRSLLCLPLLKQSRLVGMLYLENRLASGVFTTNRLATLEVLASQAAISLENSRLYTDLDTERSRLQAVVRQVPAGLLIAEVPTGGIVLANARAHDIIRQTTLRVGSVAEYAQYHGFHPDGRRYEPEEWPLARAQRTGETVDAEEIEIYRADGTRGWLSASAAPVRDAQGRIIAAVAVFQDITERRRREEALEASEERFAKAFHNSPTAMAVLRRKDWVFMEVNECFLSLFGYRQEEVVGRFCMELGMWFRDLLEQTGRRLAEGRPFRGEEFSAVDKAGEEKSLLVSVDGIALAGENCYLASFVDLTERKRVEEQLRQSQKMEAIGSLAGGVAHDFNNLLTAINGYSELLMMEMAESDRKYELARGIRASGERAADLTRQLLSFSRKEGMQTRVQSLNSIVEEMEGMLRRLIEEHVGFVTRLDPEAGFIDADKGQVEQILLNLVVNARDAMPKGGELRVETQHVVLTHAPKESLLPVGPGRYVTLTVRDTGTGMSPEVRSKIFEPFFTTKGVGKGTGLGLAVVYGIMKRLGGGIVVRSMVGQGTTFRLYFPEAKERKAETGEGQPEPKPLKGREKVLVVEDEDSVRTFMRQALSAQGYQVVEAGNGREALELLKRGEAVDLVLTDLIMPDLGGRELAERVREMAPDLPILYSSGYSRDVGSFQEMLENGEHFLAKPFGPLDLARKIREILDRPGNGR
jgi:PAS domain S-box-containing protein